MGGNFVNSGFMQTLGDLQTLGDSGLPALQQRIKTRNTFEANKTAAHGLVDELQNSPYINDQQKQGLRTLADQGETSQIREMYNNEKQRHMLDVQSKNTSEFLKSANKKGLVPDIYSPVIQGFVDAGQPQAGAQLLGSVIQKAATENREKATAAHTFFKDSLSELKDKDNEDAKTAISLQDSLSNNPAIQKDPTLLQKAFEAKSPKDLQGLLGLNSADSLRLKSAIDAHQKESSKSLKPGFFESILPNAFGGKDPEDLKTLTEGVLGKIATPKEIAQQQLLDAQRQDLKAKKSQIEQGLAGRSVLTPGIKVGAQPKAAASDMISVQIPGQAPGSIHKSRLKDFMAKHPEAQVGGQ